MNSVLNFLLLVLLGGIGCYFIIASFGSVFLDVLVFFLCLVSRDICCCVFELIFVPSGEYQSGVHSFYPLVSGISLACCKAACSLRW
jgi:hypothetical protein